MTDVLTRLRAANPLAEGTTPPIEAVWAKIEAESSSPRRSGGWHRLAVVVAIVAAAVTLGVLLSHPASSGRTAPSRAFRTVAARVYAATAPGASVVGYTAVTSYVQNGKPEPTLLRTQWSYLGRRHLTIYLQRPGHPTAQLQTEEVDGPHHTVTWTPAPSRIIDETVKGRGPRPCPNLLYCVVSSPDPVASLRAIYRLGLLHDAGTTTLAGHLVDVLAPLPDPHRTVTWQALIDPRRYVPILIREHTGTLAITTRITNYVHLAPTATTLHLLDMRPHPNAQHCTLRRPTVRKLTPPVCKPEHANN